MIRVGPAGWSYPDWEGRVYPAHKPPGFHPLAHLARFFDGIEVDSSFYALPRREHAERWARLVQDHPRFRFWVKLQRDFTHLPEPGREAGPSGEWESKAAAFRAGIEPLVRARRLEALLAQFSIAFLHGKSEIRRLGRLRALFDGLPLVLEVRHASWFTRPALDAIRGLGYSLAYVDLPPAWNHPPEWHEPTGPLGYLRLHGRNSAQWFREGAERDDRYDYLYSPPELERLARKAERIAAGHDTTAVVTNNHFSGQAVANALELLHLLRGEPVPAPPEIVESFPRLRGAVRIEGQQPLF
jgi:uncharacterized protein YecE (DUF72 family)